MLSGDWIPVSLPDRLRAMVPDVRFVSLGGATEASIWSICHDVTAVDPEWPSIPYGRALRGQSFHILDHDDRPVPVGVAGELHIGGDGVARGYVGDAAQTAERFRTHPLLGQRLYRTGDLGRWRADGTIEFLGRVDRQVKVRGHRIELGEIEAVLARQDGVRRGVVSALPGPDQRPRLVAHVVADDGWDERRTVEGLARRLPDYMIPARFVVLDALPVTANGKVDHSALPNPYASRPAPAAPVEQPVTDLWTAIRDEAEKRGLRVSVVVHAADLPPARALSAAGEWARSVSGTATQAGVVLTERLPVDGLIELVPSPVAPTFVAVQEEPVPAVIDEGVLEAVRTVFSELLGRTVDLDRPFFDLGATSLNLVVAHRRLRAELCDALAVVDLFAHNTVRALAEHISGTHRPVVRAAESRAADRRQARAMAAELVR
jgi:hypothetical protein